MQLAGAAGMFVFARMVRITEYILNTKQSMAVTEQTFGSYLLTHAQSQRQNKREVSRCMNQKHRELSESHFRS